MDRLSHSPPRLRATLAATPHLAASAPHAGTLSINTLYSSAHHQAGEFTEAGRHKIHFLTVPLTSGCLSPYERVGLPQSYLAERFR